MTLAIAQAVILLMLAMCMGWIVVCLSTDDDEEKIY